MTRWRNRQSSTKAGDAHAQAKKTSLLTRQEGLVPATLESTLDRLPRRPVVAKYCQHYRTLFLQLNLMFLDLYLDAVHFIVGLVRGTLI